MKIETVQLVTALAARNHRVVTAQELLAANVTRAGIRTLLRRGHLVLVAPGIYCVGTPSLTQEALATVALALAGAGAVLSHRSAAETRGWLRVDAGTIHVTSPQGHRAGRYLTLLPMVDSNDNGAIAVHATAPPFPQHELVDRWPLTLAERTLVDTAGLHGAKVAGWAWDEAEFRGKLDVDALRTELRERTAPGNQIVRQLLVESFPVILPGEVVASRKERAIAELLGAVDLPRPLFNQTLRLEGNDYCPDFLYPDVLAVEVDGPVHDLARRNARDKVRDADFIVNELPVLRLTTERIEQELAWCADRLVRAYAVWSSRRAA